MMPTKNTRSENFSFDPTLIERQYIIHDEIGSGGFGKVKLATHILTGEKVAIKIIDKKAIGDDLPRVNTELEALKLLSHQNICRMLQYVETEERFYIVMEYCNGGEMFDYIIRKERLVESEARHFFRQLVQAIAYIHSMGFAHRDLKPENLLLTQDLQLKVIDFGLCAMQLNGLNRPLDTCCGSPCYVAPELLQNSPYLGNEADIWSMGVLLYILLCGNLPFQDDNIIRLYRKITGGAYYEPGFFSAQSKELLRAMLQVDPKKRITIKQLLIHPWLSKNYEQPLKWNTVYNKELIDDDVAREIAFFYDRYPCDVVTLLRQWKFDYLTATYLILLHRKERKQKFSLPSYHIKNIGENKFTSPTIHASLNDDLNISGIGDSSSYDSDSDSPSRDGCIHKFTKANVIFSPPIFSPTQTRVAGFLNKPVLRGGSPNELIPHHHANEDCHRAASVRIRQQKGGDQRPKSIYATPRRAPVAGIFSPALYRRPKSIDRSQPSGIKCPDSPPSFSSPVAQSSKSPAVDRVSRVDIAKSPRLGRRICASLERKADKMISLLTPRKIKLEGPTKLKCMKTMVNVSVTSSRDPVQVRNELWRVLIDQGMVPSQNGWKISGSKKNFAGEGHTTVEMEVVSIENLDYIGVKRQRMRGDAFTYKKICEEVLRMAGM